jgi:hypothetical protein
MIKKIYTLIILAISISIGLQSNAQDFNTFKDKLYWGGNFGLSFGSYTNIQIAPVIHYAYTDELIVGLGLDYTYFKDTRDPFFSFEGSIWGPRIFGRYFVLDDFFIHAEFQQIIFKDQYSNSLLKDTWISESKFYAGGGYRSWIGTNSYMFIMLLFDLQDSEIFFGTNPFIQVGFAAGF